MENAMRLAQPDREASYFEHRKREHEQIKTLMRLFDEIDVNKSGRMSAAEFANVLQHMEVKAFFHSEGLDIKDAELFFEILVHNSNEGFVELDDFVDGCMKMKGTAKSVDIQSLNFQ